MTIETSVRTAMPQLRSPSHEAWLEGAETRFRVWAQRARAIGVVVQRPGAERLVATLEASPDGHFYGLIPVAKAGAAAVSTVWGRSLASPALPQKALRPTVRDTAGGNTGRRATLRDRQSRQTPVLLGRNPRALAAYVARFITPECVQKDQGWSPRTGRAAGQGLTARGRM
jgi:hypothetical protein